jgi:hypothetical protein
MTGGIIMRVFSFFKTDWLMLGFKTTKMLIILTMIALLLSVMQGNPYWGPLYMGFGGMILSIVPFGIKQKSDTGFLLMLPGTHRERVIGRFFFGVVLFALCLLIGQIVSLLAVSRGEYSSNRFLIFIGLFAVGMIFISLEYTMLYLIGELKSRQFMGIISMLPGFLFFFVGEWVFSEDGGIEKLYRYFLWVSSHMALSVGILFCFAAVVFAAGIFISVQAVEKRDFA